MSKKEIAYKKSSKDVTISGIPEDLRDEFKERFNKKVSITMEHIITKIIDGSFPAPEVSLHDIIKLKKGNGRMTIDKLPMGKYLKIKEIACKKGFRKLSPFLVQVLREVLNGKN